MLGMNSGFKAIITTSTGIAASLGYGDGGKLPVNKMIDVVHSIANVVNVPVFAAGVIAATAPMLLFFSFIGLINDNNN